MLVPLNELLFALSKALDFVEYELLGVTTNHGKRAAYISARICRALGMSAPDVFDMACCAVLHDNALTEYMLNSGATDFRKLENFSSHCRIGEKNSLVFPYAGDASGIVLHHHENWDGSGFHGLERHSIPMRAMALRLADNMDLLLGLGTPRPGLEGDIRRHVLGLKGSDYCPEAVDALLGILDSDFLRDVSDAHVDESLKREVPVIYVHLSTEQMLSICSLVAFIIDAKSHFTKEHSSGVAEKAARLADHYGIRGEYRNKLLIASYLHDVGKLAIPLHILEKPGPLTKKEFQIMRRHALMTENILTEVSGLEEITLWSSAHHEKINGLGYPHGSFDLPFECQLVSCCDIYQALTEDRPYRGGMDHEQAMDIMEEMVRRDELDGDIVATIKEELGDGLEEIQGSPDVEFCAINPKLCA